MLVWVLRTPHLSPLQSPRFRDRLARGSGQAQPARRRLGDTFRHFEKGPGNYSWWSQRVGVREKNIGWRIDLMLASPAAMPFINGAVIEHKVKGSDHCPVGVDVDDAILR